MENRTARLTLLIDPQKKKLFEEICAGQDLTPSQVVRKLVRQYIIDNAGNRELPDWLNNVARLCSSAVCVCPTPAGVPG